MPKDTNYEEAEENYEEEEENINDVSGELSDHRNIDGINFKKIILFDDDDY